MSAHLAAPRGRTRINNVPVLWEAVPADPEARLIFAAGYRDEPVAHAGLADLIVGFVKRHVARSSLDDYSYATADRTVFVTLGDQDARTRYLALVCEALVLVRDIDEETLESLRHEVASEHRVSEPDQGLALVCGIDDLGRESVTHARARTWSVAEVRAHAVRHFHAGTATLVLAEAPWDAIRLALPDGPAPVRRLLTSRVTSRTVVTDDDARLTCTTRDGHAPAATALALTLLALALDDASGVSKGPADPDDPLIYDAQSFGDGDLWQVFLRLDAERSEEPVSRILATFDRLTSEGPTSAELSAARQWAKDVDESPYVRIDSLEKVAVLEACGTPRDIVTPEAMQATTADEVRAVLRDVGRAPVLALPAYRDVGRLIALARDAGWTLRTTTDDPEGRDDAAIIAATFDARTKPVGPGSPEIFSERLVLPRRGRQVAVFADRIVLAERPEVRTVLLDEITLIGTDPEGHLSLLTSRGGLMTLAPRRFRGLPKVLEQALGRATHAVRYESEPLYIP